MIESAISGHMSLHHFGDGKRNGIIDALLDHLEVRAKYHDPVPEKFTLVKKDED